MSDLKVTLEKLEIFPHPNADLLELAQVGLYRAVVGKGQFESGDYALYIPEQAILPPELIEELGLTGKLAGPEKNRVKAVRLRGEISQGIDEHRAQAVRLAHEIRDEIFKEQVEAGLWDFDAHDLAADDED